MLADPIVFIVCLYVRLILREAESFDYYRSIYASLNFDQKGVNRMRFIYK